MLLTLQTSGYNVEYITNIMNEKNTETALTNGKIKLNRTLIVGKHVEHGTNLIFGGTSTETRLL
jgi:hypothetical protein